MKSKLIKPVVKTKTVVVRPGELVLHLNVDEAGLLASIVGKVTGNGDNRKVLYALFEACSSMIEANGKEYFKDYVGMAKGVMQLR